MNRSEILDRLGLGLDLEGDTMLQKPMVLDFNESAEFIIPQG